MEPDELGPEDYDEIETIEDRFQRCRQWPCRICNHDCCGWCPDCSPEVPDL